MISWACVCRLGWCGAGVVWGTVWQYVSLGGWGSEASFECVSVGTGPGTGPGKIWAVWAVWVSVSVRASKIEIWFDFEILILIRFGLSGCCRKCQVMGESPQIGKGVWNVTCWHTTCHLSCQLRCHSPSASTSTTMNRVCFHLWFLWYFYLLRLCCADTTGYRIQPAFFTFYVSIAFQKNLKS